MTQGERRFAIKWGLYATHPSGEIVRGRTYHVGATGFLFQPQTRYQQGDVMDIDIYFTPTQSVHCTGQIINSKPPYQVRFLRFSPENRALWQEKLLDLLRAKKQKEEAEAAKNSL